MMLHVARPETQVMRAIAVGVLALCAALSLTAFLQHVATGWSLGYLPFLCAAGAIYGFATQRHRRADPNVGPVPAWVLESLLLFIVVQVAVDVAQGLMPFHHWVPVVNGQAALQFVPVGLSWLAGSASAVDFASIDAGEQDFLVGKPLRRLSLRILVIGAAVFLFAGLSQAAEAAALHLPEHGASGPLFQVVLYFLVGIGLLAHASYGMRQGRWRAGAIQVAAGLSGRWAGYTLGFFALVAVAALILQFSHPLSAGTGAAQAVWSQTELWLIDLLKNFKGGSAPLKPRTLPPVTPPPHFRLPPNHGKSHVGGGSGWSTIQALLFWALLAAAVIYALRLYARRTSPGRLRLPSLPLLGRLTRFLAGVRALLARYLHQIGVRVPESVRVRAHIPQVLPERMALFLPAPRSSRARVLWYYRRSTRRLGQRGLVRRGWQTPGEYELAVAPRLDAAEPDLHRLTDAFVRARYGPHPVSEEDAGIARAAWERIRDAARHLRG